jgi:hypothetical protein
LAEYREELAAIERRGVRSQVEPEDEAPMAAALRTALRSIAPGNASASAYHRLMIGVLEFVFFPALINPQKEFEIHEGRKRIDINMSNAAASGIFHLLPTVRQLSSAFIVFECKNYSGEINNPELDQIAGRFSVNRGRVGFICCRTFDNRPSFVERCRDTFRDGRGLIIAIDDGIVASLLELIERGRRREIDSRVTTLIDEVWV